MAGRMIPVTEQEAAEVVRLYREENAIIAEIVEATGLSIKVVYRVLDKAGVLMRTRSEWRALQVARAKSKQREVVATTHREGGATVPEAKPAFAPNSMEASLIMRGVPPDEARASAKAWRLARERRHAQNMQDQRR